MSFPAKLPDRVDALFEILFRHRDQGRCIEIIAEGLPRILSHVGDLLTDVEVLLGAGRFARSRFLVATADEELGKCHVLLDAVRLDINTHSTDLKHLAHAFYNHIAKHAYCVLWRFGTTRNLYWWDMDDALKIFNVERVRFWKASSSSFDDAADEPDMPHDTYLTREMNLYVDLVEPWGWIVPDGISGSEWFETKRFGINVQRRAASHLSSWRMLQEGGGLEKSVLAAVNSIWKGKYINRKTSRDDMNALWEKTAEAVSGLCALSAESVLSSPLCFWPCYYGLQTIAEKL